MLANADFCGAATKSGRHSAPCSDVDETLVVVIEARVPASGPTKSSFIETMTVHAENLCERTGQRVQSHYSGIRIWVGNSSRVTQHFSHHFIGLLSPPSHQSTF